MAYLGGPVFYFFVIRPESRVIFSQSLKSKLQTPFMKKSDFLSVARIRGTEQDLFFRFSNFSFFIQKNLEKGQFLFLFDASSCSNSGALIALVTFC